LVSDIKLHFKGSKGVFMQHLGKSPIGGAIQYTGKSNRQNEFNENF